jgi:hypothetical protein
VTESAPQSSPFFLGTAPWLYNLDAAPLRSILHRSRGSTSSRDATASLEPYLAATVRLSEPRDYLGSPSALILP